jgi:hypothetical protein
MKQPDETPIGKRKSLLKRTSRKTPPRKKPILDKEVEQELVKVFSEK